MHSVEQNKLVRQTLDEVLASPAFAQAPKLSKFLEYVVQKTLAGKACELKGYTIGVEALGRSDDFDPQTDTTVRVLAGRLRKALDSYFREAGENQPVRISIPKGKYVPSFSFSDNAADAGEPAGQTADATPAGRALSTPGAAANNESPPRRNTLLLAVSLLLMVALLGYWTSFLKDHGHEPAQDSVAVEESYLPSISISLRVTDTSMPDWFSREEATAGTLAAFSRFKDFRTYAVETADQPIGSDGSVADYHFSILISRAGNSAALYISMTLTRQSDRSVVWSNNMLLEERDEAVGIDVYNLAGEIIAPLLSPFGVLDGNITLWKTAPRRLQCIKLFNAYYLNEDTFSKAFNCAQDAVRLGTPSSSMHAILAFLYLDAYQKQLPGVGEDPLAMAGQAARQAIELDPQNARAHHAMFAVQMTRGYKAKAIKSAAKALELNPFDSSIAGTYARYLVSIGKLEEAGAAMANAFRLNPARPARLRYFAYLQADLSGNFAAADQLAASVDPNKSPLAAMVVALYALRNKDSAKTQRAVEALTRMEPDFMAEPATALLRRGFDADIAETIAARLVAASPDTESDIFRVASQIPAGPKIGILPIQELGGSPVLSQLSRGLTTQLAHDLAKFKHLYIIASPQQNEQASSAVTSELDYILRGSSVQKKHSIQLVMQLLRASDRHVEWSHTYKRELTASTLNDVLNDISADVAVQLGTPYGLVQKLETRHAGFDSDLPLSDYACTLHFYDYMAVRSPVLHLRQRDCLLATTEHYPQFARAWSMLSRLYGDEIRFNYNLGSVRRARQSALQAALQGVRLDAGDFFTHQYLAETYALRGQHALARKSFERALQLNPNDPDLLANAGRQLVYSGDWKTGRRLTDKAIKLNPGHPRWYRLVPYIDHYRKGEYQQALAETEAHVSGERPINLLGRAVALQKMGRHREAARLKRLLLRDFGAFAADPAKTMRQLLVPAAIASDIVRTLANIDSDRKAERE